MQPELWLFLLLPGALCLATSDEPSLEVSCPHEVFSCEAKYCGCEEINEAMPVNRLLLNNLTTSTILYCKEKCSPCIRVQLTVSLAGGESKWSRGGSGSKSSKNNADEEIEDEEYNEGFELIYLSAYHSTNGINRCARLKVRFHPTDHELNTSPKGTVELRCFRAYVSSNVLIKAFPKRANQKDLQQTHEVEDCTLEDFLENITWCKVPNINTTLEDETQVAVINIPENSYMLFKYNVVPPFDSINPLVIDNLKMTEVRLNFSDIVPCLCVQAWSAKIEDAIRAEKCPFSQYKQFQENIWKLSGLAVEYKGKALQWTFSSPCSIVGEISLCSKTGDSAALCHEIPHSRQTIQINKLSEFQSVDPHPSLCIKIISGDHVNFSCPFDSGHSLLWKVKSEVKHRNVTLTILHAINEMNFSICTVKGNKCDHFLQNMEVINEQKKQLNLISQDCFQVWRSDVQFSPRITICPFDIYARARWTPLLVPFLILVTIVIFTITIKTQILKGCVKVIKFKPTATVADCSTNGKVLLLYSLDYNLFEKLVSTLAYVLCELKLQVAVDLWKRRELVDQGPLPWFHSQKNKVTEEGGKILILFSNGASMKYNEWFQSSEGTKTMHDPYDGFMASLNCVLPDIIKGNVFGKYVVAYFEDLQKKEDIPDIFNIMPIYSLPSQLPEFLQEIGVPANVKSGWKATSYQSTIKNSLDNVIKECQLWEQTHMPWSQDHCKLEWIPEGQQENDTMTHCPLIQMEMLSMI
ncbi:interleukin-17 receptor C-like isoform X1 [Chiloscyllium plagiosum]|uniref:interleukin-17 receptor C-like isoform X1 n=2 Tax=Chiloscyllium plagiosum TaxID=36176 RepID=UPI001CB8252F|nr:interleukin-17 receptor C-like isoform X1 [Chiloscyllium plagiosum]